MFFFNYLRRELTRRAGRTFLTVAGLAVGVTLVVAITALSGGLDTAQSRVLNPLASVGTDLLVTRPVEATPAPGTGAAGTAQSGAQSNGGTAAAGANGAEGVPVPSAPALAGTATVATGKTVDGISCNSSEQLVYHIHAHLTVFVNGAARQVPAAIGIPGAQAENTPNGPFIASGTCFYWLHTHAADGIIHIESPVQRTYTLGEFFDEWGQPLGPSQAGPAHGKVTVIVNGQVFKGNPRDVPLGSHENLQVQVGTPLVAPETINWANTGL